MAVKLANLDASVIEGLVFPWRLRTRDIPDVTGMVYDGRSSNLLLERKRHQKKMGCAAEICSSLWDESVRCYPMEMLLVGRLNRKVDTGDYDIERKKKEKLRASLHRNPTLTVLYLLLKFLFSVADSLGQNRVTLSSSMPHWEQKPILLLSSVSSFSVWMVDDV